MAIDFVSAPAILNINLTHDTDFIRLLEAVPPSEFPAGCQVKLEFRAGTTVLDTWDATVTTTEAMFNVDKVDVNAVIAGAPTSARLKYVDGSVDLLWGLASTVGIDG